MAFPMHSMLLMIICVSVVNSNGNICPLIKRNDAFNGIGLYRHLSWRVLEDYPEWVYEAIPSYHMYANGKEWEIGLNIDRKNQLTDIVFDGNLQTWDKSPKVLLIFYIKVFITQRKVIYRYQCTVYEKGTEIEIKCCCDYRFRWGELKEKGVLIDFETQFNASEVIAFNRDTKELKGYKQKEAVIVLLNRNTRKVQFYSPFWKQLYEENGCTECTAPAFVPQIGTDMNIEAITEYDIDHKAGHLLVFNVNGIPKYCVTPEGKNLSEMCKSKNLKILFKKCFNESIPTPSSPSSGTKSNGISKIVWILSLILIIVLAICSLIGIWVYLRKRKLQNMRSTTSATSTRTESQIMSFINNLPEDQKPYIFRGSQRQHFLNKLSNETKGIQLTAKEIVLKPKGSPKLSNVSKTTTHLPSKQSQSKGTKSPLKSQKNVSKK